MPLHKPDITVQLSVPRLDSRTDFVLISPEVLEAKWTRNNHLVADELMLTFSWKESGLDPRQIHNARCAMYMWDRAYESFNAEKHLRFTGICVKVNRKKTDGAVTVEMTFHDYTSMFINMKPFPTRGMPEWNEDLTQIWEKICDNTGYYEPGTDKIISAVEALRDNLIFRVSNDAFAVRKLGETVNPRFHAISKPSPPKRCDAWAVWQYVVTSLGLLSFIDGDQCIVADASKHYDPKKAAKFIWGENILEFDEEADCAISQKGVLAQSFDPLTGQVMEAFYPPIGDERIKTKKQAINRAAKGKGAINANDTSGEYEPYEANHIHDQAALDRWAANIFEERSRQGLEGSFKTVEMRATDPAGNDYDILDYGSGDAIIVGVRQDCLDLFDVEIKSEDDRVRFLVFNYGYDEGVARLIAKNIDQEKFQHPVFHISSMEVELGPEKFNIEIKYHNILALDQV